MTEIKTAPPSATRRSVCAALVSLPAVSLAQLRVEITGVGSQQFPISIASFARDGQVPLEIEQVVRADLARSGRFRLHGGGGDGQEWGYAGVSSRCLGGNGGRCGGDG